MQLTPGQFFEWKLKLEQMFHAETKAQLISQNLTGMEKDVEIMKLRNMLYKQQVKNSQDARDNAKKEYEDFRTSLEAEIGTPLAGKLINEATYEITDPPSN